MPVDYKYYNGNALEELKKFPDKSVHLVTTSPPYWGLRKYEGIPDYIWPVPNNEIVRWPSKDYTKCKHVFNDSICYKCGAWKGQLGSEPTYELFLEHLWMIMDEIYRVLRDDGCCFINLGDCYAGLGGVGTMKYAESGVHVLGGKAHPIGKYQAPTPKTMEPDKCLLLIPHKFAAGCTRRGWILRNDVIWAKPNGMPESVTDRLSKKHEYFFFFVKSNKTLLWYHTGHQTWTDKKPEPDYVYRNNLMGEFRADAPENWNELTYELAPEYQSKVPKDKAEDVSSPRGRHHREQKLWTRINLWRGMDYYFDLDSIREPHNQVTIERMRRGTSSKNKWLNGAGGQVPHSLAKPKKNVKAMALEGVDTEYMGALHPRGKNPGDVTDFWKMHAPLDYKEYMEMCSEHYFSQADFWAISTKAGSKEHFASFNGELLDKPILAGCPKGGWVLDPFNGTGTTMKRAMELGRNAIGIEGSGSYYNQHLPVIQACCDMANRMEEAEKMKIAINF